jgi:hypothetical protein
LQWLKDMNCYVVTLDPALWIHNWPKPR